MADATLSGAFAQAIINLEAIIRLSLPNVTDVYSYVVPESSTVPYAQFFITNSQYARASDSTQSFNVNVRVRVVVDRILAGYDGQSQNRGQWVYTPALLEGFQKHGGLNYPGATPVPLLDTVNTGAPTMTTAIEGHDFVLIFNWLWVFRTTIPRC